LKSEVRTAQSRFCPVSARIPDLKQPIIIIGMHRSGTSLVAGMLTALGVFVDPAMRPPRQNECLPAPDAQQRRDGYGEAEIFRLLNDMILARSGATWDHVQPFLDHRDSAWMTRTNLLLMKDRMRRSLSSDFLSKMPDWLPGNWGWKDPRNSLTLPYWLRLFPEARILHVRRNSEGVANSLMRRAPDCVRDQASTRVAMRTRLRSLGRRLVLHPRGVATSIGQRLGVGSKNADRHGSVTDHEYCLHLSRQYVNACLQYRTYGSRYLEIEYEQILYDPASSALRLAYFAGVPASATRILQAAHFVQLPRSLEAMLARGYAVSSR
jgi:hypothetical protein